MSRLVNGRGFVEVRRKTFTSPNKAKYLEWASARWSQTKVASPTLLACLVPELGAPMQRVIELHAFRSYDERDAALSKEQGSHDFPSEGMTTDLSEVYVEALECSMAAGANAEGVRAFTPANTSSSPVYEWREYQLELGYNPIPKLREAFMDGLPSKVAADPELRGEVAFMGYTDVGHLNRFVELWRFRSVQDAMSAREAGRVSAEWRKAIGIVAPMAQSFSTAFYRPATHSPWQ